VASIVLRVAQRSVVRTSDTGREAREPTGAPTGSGPWEDAAYRPEGHTGADSETNVANEFWSGRRGIDEQHATPEPEEIARRVALFRRGRHEEIEGAGHMVHYDAPDRLVESTRRFLDRLPA